MAIINGCTAEADGMTVFEYLVSNNYGMDRIAVELNGSILPKSDWDRTVLKREDVLETVSFVGGG